MFKPYIKVGSTVYVMDGDNSITAEVLGVYYSDESNQPTRYKIRVPPNKKGNPSYTCMVRAGKVRLGDG